MFSRDVVQKCSTELYVRAVIRDPALISLDDVKNYSQVVLES